MADKIGTFNGYLVVDGLKVGVEQRFDVPRSNRIWVPRYVYEGGQVFPNFNGINGNNALLIRFTQDAQPSGPWGVLDGYRNEERGEFDTVYVTVVAFAGGIIRLAMGLDINGGHSNPSGTSAQIGY